jgi:tetraacyldisaccharide 4'-kinase
MGLQAWIPLLWYSECPYARALLPLAWIYQGLVACRRWAYRSGLLRVYRPAVPVIVVGNLTVGGAGKTPLVLWLTHFLADRGYRPGIVSRGYGGRSASSPREVTAASDPLEVGDEPVLLARRSGVPVVVDPRRNRAVQWLLARHACNIVLSDDGLQHLALARDIEIVVIDGTRKFGNGYCLPAGPLREPLSRLGEADILVSNGAAMPGAVEMQYRPGQLCAVSGDTSTNPAPIVGERIHAVAGIGNPGRFFADLHRQGWLVIEHPYPDHYAYAAGELEFGDDLTVIMTEKDAVKYAPYAGPRHWYLPIDAQLPDSFGQGLLDLLTRNSP